MTEDEMVGWHHQLNGHEFEQAQGDSEGQGSLLCCSPWGCNELDTSEQLNSSWKAGRGREATGCRTGWDPGPQSPQCSPLPPLLSQHYFSQAGSVLRVEP